MKNGIGPTLLDILQSFAPLLSSSKELDWSIVVVLEKTMALLRELCIHNDNRSEMSSAFENGKWFIKQTQLIPLLVTMIQPYEDYPQLAANTLLAIKAMITTNEAVQIIALHGMIELLSTILSSYVQLILQIVQGESVTPSEINKTIEVVKGISQSIPQSEEEQEEEEVSPDPLENMNRNSMSTTTTTVSSYQPRKVSPLLLLRAVIALIRNIIADDKKKEQLVTLGALQSLLVLFLHSQQISSVLSTNTTNNSTTATTTITAETTIPFSNRFTNDWNVPNDYFLIEHLFGCFAQFTLRAPKNTLVLLHPDHYPSFLTLLIAYMQKYSTQDSLHRQICLMLHNMINRCPEYKQIFLDYHLEEYLQTISGQLPTVKDESYMLLRDLGINIQYMKVDEITGKLVPVYESFGQQSNKNFRPVYDETDHLQNRMVEESRAPFAATEMKEVVVEINRTSDDRHDGDHDDHDHTHHHHHEHSEHCNHEKSEETSSTMDHSHDHAHP